MKVLPWLLAVALCAPAAAQIYAESSLIHDVGAEPGGRYEGSVPVVNRHAEDRRVRLYLTDYAYTADGESHYAAPGTLAHSAAAWVEVGAPEVTVPAGGTTEVRYAITVPPDAAPSGTRWCVLMIEIVPEGGPGGPRTGLGLSRRVRFAHQIAVRLGAPEPDLRLLRTAVAADAEGGPQLWVDVENAGEGAADVLSSIEVFDADARPVGRIDGSKIRLYPGTSARYVLPLRDLPPGDYQGLFIAEDPEGGGIGAQLAFRR